MTDFCRAAKCTAQKEYRCEMCGGAIHSGEKYYRETGKWEGEFFDAALHIHCRSMRIEFCRENDDKFGDFYYYIIIDDFKEKHCCDCGYAVYNSTKNISGCKRGYSVTNCPEVIKLYSDREDRNNERDIIQRENDS